MDDVLKAGYILRNSRTSQYYHLTINIDRHTNRRTELIDLTKDDDQYLNSNIPVIDLTEDDNPSFNSNIPVIDLTKDDNQYFNSNIPVIDLTSDNDRVANNRIPVIDLADDEVMDIDDQMQCIDLKNYSSSNSSHTNRYFDLTRNEDRDSNLSAERIDLTDLDSQNFNLNVPLTCNNDEFANCRIPGIIPDVQDITHQLQHIYLTDHKQELSKNDGIPTTDLTYDNGQNIDQTIPDIHLTSREGYENYRKPVCDLTYDNIAHNVEGLNLTDHFTPAIDMIQKDRVVREPVDDAEIFDAETRSCYNLPINCQKSIAEDNPRIFVENPSYDATENNILKYNETSNMNLKHTDTSYSMRQYQFRKEITLTNLPLTNFEERNLSYRKYEEISQNDALDLFKPARHPIPFRHSLGRSTINTSKNVPIECTDAPEDASRTITVSSTFRRKKSKSSSGISKQNLSNSLGPPTSRADTFYFGAFKDIILKFCIFFIFLCIFLIFIRYFTGF